MAATPIPIWLDCDPGHDDAFAILLAAHHPAFNLLGVSTVFGNASLEKTTVNALSILTSISKTSIPVYPGASKALVRPGLHAATSIHGESGIDGTTLLPKPLAAPNTSVPAIDAMAAALLACAPGTAWLVATGSFTNVAACLAAYPQLAAHLAGVSVMGGAVGDGFTDAVAGMVGGKPRIGNMTPHAEFNIYIDPEAAAAVLGHPELKGKVTMIPLDVTHLVLATEEVQTMLRWGPGGPDVQGVIAEGPAKGKGKTTLRVMLVELLTFFAATYKNVFGIGAPPLHDPIAVAACLVGVVGHEISFYDYDARDGEGARRRERYEVTVVTEGTHEDARRGAQTGRTVVRLLEPGEEGVRIPRGLDISKFWQVIEECCERADVANTRNGIL